MKTCPICKARCFDDMETCYGCMHRFADDEAVADELGQSMGPVHDVPAHDDADRADVLSEVSAKAEPSRAAARRETPRVFGAVDSDEDAREYVAPTAAAGLRERDASDGAAAVEEATLTFALGPVFSASLGNGYRIVASIERE